MFTDDQIRQLEKPFALDEHAFVSSNVFIKKSAIRHRLHQIDPAWSMTEPDIVTVINDVITLRAGLTINGVTRFAVGTGLINRYTKDGVERSPGDIMRETAKAMKTADSDLLPRCASKFGVGDYLRNMTKADRDSVRDMNSLKKFLDGQIAPHWAHNGGGQRINEKIKLLNLKWDQVAGEIEPGKKLTRLSDTTLTEKEFAQRLDAMAVNQLTSPASDVHLKTTSDVGAFRETPAISAVPAGEPAPKS